jgi:ketosteroid isomerase-like protein
MIERAAVECLLERLYAARIAGNLDALCGLFTTDAVFEITGVSQSKPIAIRTAGSGEFRPWLALLLKTFRLTDHVLITVIIDDNRAAVRWRARIHSRITGAEVITDVVDLIEITSTHILSYIEFFSGSMPSPR